MQRSIAVLSLCAGLAVSGMTRAQSFNIEVNNGAITAVSNSFGAAGLPGAWNSYNSSSPATIPLVNLDGSASGVTFTRSLVANYATAATANISDFKAVLDDYQFVTGVSQMSMTFNNLQPGVYMIIVYNAAPSVANTASYWSAEQISPMWNYGGGTVGANTFKPLRTHNYMVCQTNGSNAINVKVQAAAGEARVSAIQIVKLDSDWRVYVNTPTRGSQAGTSWLSAMGDLQDALNIARVLEDRCEIWVGSGTYKPTAGTDRTLAFDVSPGVSIYGGFAGTETSISQRSGLPADETILSGAIGTAAATDNSRTVVKVNFAGTRAVTLDGLTVRDGRGDVGDVGGGLWISGSNVNIRNCLIRDNYSQSGGGLYMKNSSVFAEDSRFVDNQAEETGGKGGAVYVDLGTAASQFNANRCRFTGNYSEDGSVLYNNGRSISLMNSLINSNNVYVYGQSAPIHLVGAASVNSIVNCTASNNQGHFGTVIFLEDAADLAVTNSILWWNFQSNQASPYRRVIGFTNVNSDVTASHSVFTDETPFTGPGVTIGDPMFVDPDGADDILGTDDDNYRLSFGSPSLDSGVNQVGGNFLVDLDLNPRMLDLPSVANTGGSFGVGYIDRGCYERPITVCPADFDESGFVDSDDFVMFSEHFALGCTGAGQGAMGAEPACLKSADFDDTGFVDSDDFVAFVDAFNTPCNP